MIPANEFENDHFDDLWRQICECWYGKVLTCCQCLLRAPVLALDGLRRSARCYVSDEECSRNWQDDENSKGWMYLLGSICPFDPVNGERARDVDDPDNVVCLVLVAQCHLCGW